ncbi:MAG: hypothetical protein IPH88_01380 [Bacteroidales bacterium]|nr:hypothetical protein [Bacteroidales bacterium]
MNFPRYTAILFCLLTFIASRPFTGSAMQLAPSCGTYSLPFSESFSGTSIPTCWTQIDHIGNGQIWQFGTFSSSVPPALNGNYAYLNSDGYGSGNSQSADLISPTINCSSSAALLTFKHYFKSYSGSNGVLSYSIDNGVNWTPIQTFTSTSTTNPSTFSQIIYGVSGSSQVKFKWNYTGTWGYYWAIDDIQITSTCTEPTIQAYYMQTTNVTATSMHFSWNRGNGNGTLIAVRTAPITATPGNGISYTANTVCGSGSDLGGGTYVVYSGTDTTCTVTNMQPNSWYYISLFEYNTPSYCYNTTNSQYISNTLCSTISSFPYHEDFEHYGYSPICWEQQYVSGTLLWSWDATSGGGGIPASAHSGTYITRFYDATAGTPNVQKLISPKFNLTNRVNNTLSFWHTQAASTLGQDVLKVYYKTSIFGTWNLLATYSGNVSSWTQRTVQLPNPSSDYYFAFEGTENGGHGICIDDLTLDGDQLELNVTPTTQTVSAVADTATFDIQTPIAWTATSSANWCAVTASGTGNSTLQAVYQLNTSLEPRTATITITVSGLSPVIVTLVQEGKIPYLNISPASQTVGNAAGSTVFTVSSNCDWTSSSDQNWCLSTASGSGSGNLQAIYSQNTTLSSRTANITVSVAGLPPVVITVTQAAAMLPGIRYTMANDVQTSDRTLEFDLLLLDTDPSQPFELATVQAGILVNSSIYNGGTLTASIVPGTSTLNSSQQPSSITFTQTANIIKLASKAPPGTGNGSIISSNSSSPSRICRIKLTNSLPFNQATPDLTFNLLTYPYATKLSQYVNNINTAQILNNDNCFSNCQNNLLNPPPVLSIDPTIQTVTAYQGVTTFNITSNIAWTVSSNQNWCTVLPSGYGNASIQVNYSENSSTEPRTAILTFTSASLPPVTATVVQQGLTSRTLNLSLFLQGLCSGHGIMDAAMDQNGPHWGSNIADKITIELRNASNYEVLVHSVSFVNLSTNGQAAISIPASYNGSYYITVIHRNSIETTSTLPVSLATAITSYSFDNPSKAYGNNMKFDYYGNWTIYGGDINQDGLVDASDMMEVDNANRVFATGYLTSDANGDGLVDSGDAILVDNNASQFVEKVVP